MPSYDPQRNRARARPVVGDPAPVDQILGRPEPAAAMARPAAAMVPTASVAATVPPVSPRSPVDHDHAPDPDPDPDHDHAHLDHDRRRGFAARPVLVAVVATVATAVLVLRWRRGRRV